MEPYQENMKKLFKHIGSQSKLARILGVSRQSISHWYTGERDMPMLYGLRIEVLTQGKFKATDFLSKDKLSYVIQG